MRIFFEWLGLIISTVIIVGLTFIISWMATDAPWTQIYTGLAFILCCIGAYFKLHRKLWRFLLAVFDSFAG